jgi:ATP-dependent helicase/nuclease subunit A
MGDVQRRAAQLSLFGDAPAPVPRDEGSLLPPDKDASARQYAVDPANNVVLEASAGTGKTTVLVSRYVNLLKAGIDPANILAITFTRKAAAEMRERIVSELRDAAGRSEFDKARWNDLRNRLGEIAISTIDAFCLSLLREFPLEADLDPGFDMADPTEVPRLVDDALDRAMRIFVRLAGSDPDVALVLAQLGTSRTRDGLAVLIDRRLVAWDALNRFLARGPADLTAQGICRGAATALHDVLQTVRGGLPRFLEDGPAGHPRYSLFLRELARLPNLPGSPDAVVRASIERISAHFLTEKGRARKAGTAVAPYKAEHYPSKDAARRHRDALFEIAPRVEDVLYAFNRDLNVVLARGIRRMFAVAIDQYRLALAERSMLDFSDVLERALALLRQMDEFAQSRFRLESRYHHVLVDEFQDTSRAQWELVSLLVQAWGEGAGLATRPSIFIVGDRKQSIYRFRDAEVGVLHQAGLYVDALRPGCSARRSIARSFRAVPELLAFVNDVFAEVSQPPTRSDAFTYSDDDRFPILDLSDTPARTPALGLAVAESVDECAAAVAVEIDRILREDSVRDKKTGLARPARPGDIGILFRSRASHREFERELGARSIPAYVYKGLGFFDADEIKDVVALMRYLANPVSDLRAAAFLRSRFVRLSDDGLARLAPRVSRALLDDRAAAGDMLNEEDRRALDHARMAVRGWIERVDRVAPADLIEQILVESAYAYELRGTRRRQAWENLKKMRGLVRRIQNRGYLTLARIAEYIDALSAGDESNAVLEALDAVNLMTVHAAKGLEFPIVFVVNISKGASGPPHPVRVIVDGAEETSVSVGPFVSEMEEADRERERDETRRMLYVALTRARDRLYLSSVLKNGSFVPGRGSLGEVLPESLEELFGRAAGAFDEFDRLSWTSVSGRAYEWRLCRAPDDKAVAEATDSERENPVKISAVSIQSDGEWQSVNLERRDAPAPTAVTRWLSESEPSASSNRSDSLTGILVHRLFQFTGLLTGAPSRAEVVDAARRLIRETELAAVADAGGAAGQAAEIWLAMKDREDVFLALEGRRYYEVPFSIQFDDVPPVLRGTIDCLVQRADGSMVVVEFKTGQARESHQQQLDIYVEAARRLFPAVAVTGVLLYA